MGSLLFRSLMYYLCTDRRTDICAVCIICVRLLPVWYLSTPSCCPTPHPENPIPNRDKELGQKAEGVCLRRFGPVLALVGQVWSRFGTVSSEVGLLAVQLAPFLVLLRRARRSSRMASHFGPLGARTGVFKHRLVARPWVCPRPFPGGVQKKIRVGRGSGGP